MGCPGVAARSSSGARTVSAASVSLREPVTDFIGWGFSERFENWVSQPVGVVAWSVADRDQPGLGRRDC